MEKILVGKVNGNIAVFQLLETTPTETVKEFKTALENGDLKKMYELRGFISQNSFTIFVELGDEVALYSRQKIATLEVGEDA